MANTTLTADIIAREAVMILDNNLVMGNLVFRGYEEEFGKKVNGYTVGDTISIRRPTDFTVRSGATAASQDVVEGKTTIQISQQKGVDFKFTSTDLTLKIGDLSERVIKPAMVQLANQVDEDLMALYKQVPRRVSTDATNGINSYANFALAPKLMDKGAVPQDDRNAVLGPDDHWNLLGSQTALYMQDVARGVYRNAKLGMIGGVDTYMAQNVPTHTAGSRSTGGAVNQSIVNGTFTWAAYANADSGTMAINSLSGATVTVKQGDTFTIAGVYDVNPVTKVSTGSLKQFVVMADATASGSAIASLSFAPVPIFSGAKQNIYTALTDLNTAVITWQGAASTAYTENLFFHKNAFALVTVPMVSPPGAVEVGRRSYKGISVRVIPYYDGINDVSNWRLDVLYGVKAIDHRLAVRASKAANI